MYTKRTYIVIILLATGLIYATPIPWPVGLTGPDSNNSYSLMNTYGEMNNDWSPVGPGLYINFHTGIDISSADIGSDNVWCAKDGVYTDVHAFIDPASPTIIQYIATVCDNSSSLEGWTYCHVNGTDGYPYTMAYVESELNRGTVDATSGDLIGTMIIASGQEQHLHFARTEPFVPVGYQGIDNPLNYLSPSATGAYGFNWFLYTYGKSSFFLPDYLAFGDAGGNDWENLWPSPLDVLEDSLDRSQLSGSVDLFVNTICKGQGNIGVPVYFTMPQSIEWSATRLLQSSSETLLTRYVVDFNNQLGASGSDPSDWMEFKRLYFKYFGNDLEGGGPKSFVVCLTNCEDASSFDGIDNIEENSWQTNGNQELTDDTVNPILAAYPDGSYQLDILISSYDPSVFSTPNSACELHNFSPALRQVVINSLETDETYYYATWEPNTSGTSADLDITIDNPALAGAEVQVILIFTEEMNTSQGISVILGPLSVSGTWSSSVVLNDTWTGEVTLPTSLTDGSYILSVGVEDVDGNHLMDPEGVGAVPGPTRDTHHSLLLGFETGLEWTVSVHDQVLGSPKLADVNQNGHLEIVIQSADGWVDVIASDGNSLPGWPIDNEWAPCEQSVTASPAIADFTGSSALEIVSVIRTGTVTRNSSGTQQFTTTLGSNGWILDSSPIVGDFDNNGDNELAIGRQMVTNSSIPFDLVADDTDGTMLWIKYWGTDESVTATPTLVDIDNDGDLELIVITDLTNYPQNGPLTNGTIRCIDSYTGDPVWTTATGATEARGSIASGELVSGTNVCPEIVIVEKAGSTFTLRVLSGPTGYIAYTNSISNCPAGGSGASIADINGDGTNDIIVSCSDGILYCFNGEDGSDVPGFPVNLGTWTDDGVSIGDIDSDYMLELVIAGKDGCLHVINHDGTAAAGFPVVISSCNPLSGQPALGDIDDDGRLEIIIGEQNNSVLHCYEMGENSGSTYLPWPQFQRDAMNTGFFPTDIIPPDPPANLGGPLVPMGNRAMVDLSWSLSPDDPEDVYAYRIYRKDCPYGSLDLIGTVPAGTTSYVDYFRIYPYYIAMYYHITAWDGVLESLPSTGLKLSVQDMNCVSLNCPVREISHSAGIRTSQSQTSVETGTGSSLSDIQSRSNYRVLTDGAYDEVYSPAGSSDCVEIDLGDVFSITKAFVFSGDISLSESSRYELSVDGRIFSRTDSGRARYIRVYNAAGASEIEVYGENTAAACAPVEIQRSTDSGYRIATVESGAPITATVFDLSGRSIWQNTSSTGEVLWNRCSSSGNTVPAGVYLIMVESDDIETFTSKVVVR